jgi:hypothetical protein
VRTLHCRTSHFGNKEAQDQAAKIAKPPTSGTPRPSTTKKSVHAASAFNQQSTNQKADNKKKGTTTEEDKDILVDPNDVD